MKTMIDNQKIAKMEKDIKATDAKVKTIKSVPASTAADAGKVLTVQEDGSVSWQTKGAGGGMKAFFDAGGKCGYSTATSFEGAIAFDATSNVTSMYNMFYYCSSLTSVPLFDTSNVTSMSSMFDNCSSLTSVPLFDTSNVTNMSSMFYHCSSLETIHMKNIGVSLDIHYSTKFTREALVEIIGNLKSVTSTKTLTIGSTNLDKLTDAEKQVATEKGWTLA